jgi:Zn-finger protein
MAETYQGFTHYECEFYPCHSGIKEEFNCLFCYCPLYNLECPGNFKWVISSTEGLIKDCSSCIISHDGYKESYDIIQLWLAHPS